MFRQTSDGHFGQPQATGNAHDDFFCALHPVGSYRFDAT
jgi:hypothetical protein